MSPWDRSLMGDPATDLAVTLARWRGRLRIGTASASMLLLVGTGAFAIVASAPPSLRDPLVMDLADGAVKQGPAADGGSSAIAAGGGAGAVSGGSAGEDAAARDSILDRLRALGEELGFGVDRGLAAGGPSGRDDEDVAVTDPATEPTDEASGSGVDGPTSAPPTPEGPIEEPSPQPPSPDPTAPIEDPSPPPPTDDGTQGPPDGRTPGPPDGRRPVDPPTTGPPADPPSGDPPRGRPTDGPPANPPSDEPPVDPPSRRPTDRDDRRAPSDPSPSSTRSSKAATPGRPSISPSPSPSRPSASPSRSAGPSPSASPTRSASPSPRATRPASPPPRVDDVVVDQGDQWCADKPGRGPRDNPAASSGNPGRGAESGYGKHERVCTTDSGRGRGPN